VSVWPAWKVREGGGITSWFHVRLAFADGARVELLAVVCGGSASIEDIRAQPALSLVDLKALADWIEGPLFANRDDGVGGAGDAGGTEGGEGDAGGAEDGADAGGPPAPAVPVRPGRAVPRGGGWWHRSTARPRRRGWTPSSRSCARRGAAGAGP
jgi:hypothetical protein